MKPPSSLIVSIGIAVLFAPVGLHAYPISPVPLWDLVESSSLIVLADVVNLDDPRAMESPDPGDSEAIIEHVNRDATAHLQVEEVWKGNWSDRVRVRFEAMLVCPAPARYVPGKKVLAFLHRNDEGLWRTTSLSYGTLYPAGEGIAAFRSLVRRAVRLQDSGISDDDYRDWLVTAASHPATRWHGLYPMIPKSDALHSYYDRRKRVSIIDQLTVPQIGRIADAFIAAPPTDRTLPMALAALASYSGERLDLAALASMEAVVSMDPVPWWAKDALKYLLKRFMNKNVVETRLEALEDYESDSKQIRAIWKHAKEELGLPDVEPAEVTSPEVWRVGSNTPS